MAEVIRVDYEALAKIAGQFQQEAEAIEEMLQMMRGSMAPLQDGGWVGRGSDAFFSEMEKDILPAVRRLADALSQAGEVSQKIGDVLQGAEDEACSPFRQDAAGAAAGQGAGTTAGGMGTGAAGGSYGTGTGAAGGVYSGAGGAYSGGYTGAGSGSSMYVPQDWLNNVGGFAPGSGGHANDWGIPQNWLDGVAGAIGIGGGGNYGVPQDWLDGVRDAFSGGGLDGGTAVGGSTGGAGGVSSGAGGAPGGSSEPSAMSSGGSGGGKETAAADIRSPFGNQAAKTGASTLFGGEKAVAEAQNGRLSYQSLGGAGFAPAAGGAPAPAASSGAGGTVPSGTGSGSSSTGIGLAIAALTPLAGIMGKAVKDALDND